MPVKVQLQENSSIKTPKAKCFVPKRQFDYRDSTMWKEQPETTIIYYWEHWVLIPHCYGKRNALKYSREDRNLFNAQGFLQLNKKWLRLVEYFSHLKVKVHLGCNLWSCETCGFQTNLRKRGRGSLSAHSACGLQPQTKGDNNISFHNLDKRFSAVSEQESGFAKCKMLYLYSWWNFVISYSRTCCFTCFKASQHLLNRN